MIKSVYSGRVELEGRGGLFMRYTENGKATLLCELSAPEL